MKLSEAAQRTIREFHEAHELVSAIVSDGRGWVPDVWGPVPDSPTRRQALAGLLDLAN
jgi:hypothetical protein